MFNESSVLHKFRRISEIFFTIVNLSSIQILFSKLLVTTRMLKILIGIQTDTSVKKCQVTSLAENENEMNHGQ